jgi:hypothetical protein
MQAPFILLFYQFLLVDKPEMRFHAAAFHVLLASGRLFCTPVFTVVHALPCLQKALLVSSSSDCYPANCSKALNNWSVPVENYNILNGPPSTISARAIDQSQNTYSTPTFILIVVLFITLASLLIVLLLFGPRIRSSIVRKRLTEEKPKLGFGFDGLSKGEMKRLRLEEEKAAMMKSCWFPKLPARPPALVLRHSTSPLLPIHISRDECFRDAQLDEEQQVGHKAWTKLSCRK